MDGDDNTYNPVEQYMKNILDSDKPEKPPETTASPTNKLEIKGTSTRGPKAGTRDEALKVSDVIKQKIPAERRIFSIRQHPIGFVLVLLAVIISYAATFSIISFLLPGIADVTGLDLSALGPVVGYIMLFMVAVGVIFLLVFGLTYKLSKLELTDLNISGTLWLGYFSKKSFRLPIADIENITVNKSGVFPTLFNYGTLLIKTNKNRNDIVFRYAPSPDICAKAVLDSKLEHLASRSFTSP